MELSIENFIFLKISGVNRTLFGKNDIFFFAFGMKACLTNF
jgi:hypothetical protein